MLKVIHKGLFTSIQDLGRFGQRHYGVPTSGCMDRYSAQLLNKLLENDPNDAQLEITMMGPKLVFTEPTYISLGGALMDAYLNEEKVCSHEVIKIAEGDILKFGKLHNGYRIYLAIKGGFTTSSILESRSQFRPITPKSHIGNGDELPYRPCSNFEPLIQKIKAEDILETKTIEVSKGPEFEILGDADQKRLMGSSFTVAKENNRMGYQFEEFLNPHSHKMITSATLPGTVQLTPKGKLIALMRDGQTTGGYPRILQLSEKSIAVLAQKKAGESIEFKMV